ncbi:hypothetical protein D9M68_957420 [compost metagenome]
MGLVKNNPAQLTFRLLQQRRILFPNQHVLQHGCVRDQDLRWAIAQFGAIDHLTFVLLVYRLALVF